MTLNFPNSPSSGDQFTGSNNFIYQYDGEKWNFVKLVGGDFSSGAIQDGAVTTAKLADANVTTAKIADANVTTAKLADASVTPAKLSAGSPGWTTSGALGLNGANYGTEYQIAQSNGSGAASTWVNRSTIDSEINLVSSPADSFKNITFDTAALSWAKKIDIYFRDVSCDSDPSNLNIKLIDQTNNPFSSGTLVGFQTVMINNTFSFDCIILSLFCK